MNKKYITVPAILAAICAVSGGLIGGVHALTATYMETHKKVGAPDEIEALYNDGSTFSEVEGFEAYDFIGPAGYKVKITSVYQVNRGGNKVGYAYLVEGVTKPVNTATVVAVSFEGDVSADNKASLKPTKINLSVAGDSGYEAKVEAYVKDLTNGADLTETWTGGTSKSSQSVFDSLNAAREDYVARWNGQDAGGPVDETKAYLTMVVPTLASYEEDTSFTQIVEAWDGKENGIRVTNLFKVTTSDEKVVDVYQASSFAYIDEEGAYLFAKTLTSWTQEITAETAVEDVTFDKYTVMSSTYSYSEWQSSYLDGIAKGEKDIDSDTDVVTGATYASKSIQKTLQLERDHYFNAHKAA